MFLFHHSFPGVGLFFSGSTFFSFKFKRTPNWKSVESFVNKAFPFHTLPNPQKLQMVEKKWGVWCMVGAV